MKKCHIIIIIVMLANGVFFILPKLSYALPAFPGAVGFGSDTPGGRSGILIEVTNLNAIGPGSFREACETPGSRIVVFRTGGTITITSPIEIRNPYITIAGQTAPGDGITIRGAAILITTHDVIIRGIRIRVGDDPSGPSYENRDALQIQGQANPPYNVIIDHCSLSWAVDEILTIWDPGNHDITISNTIISEALYDSFHPDGPHSKGSLVDQDIKRISYIGNLFVHNDERNPRVRFTSGVIVNNVVYNSMWRDVDIDFGTAAQTISIVGNYFIKGNNHNGNAKSIFIRNGLIADTKIFVDDNDCSDYRTGNCVVNRNIGFNPIVDTAPIWPAGLGAMPSSEALEWVLFNAGARPEDPDSVDARIISDVENITGSIIDSQDQVGGWPDLKHGTPPQDADHDGMPNSWENEHSLNPNDPADGNKDRNGDGYTNIEEYINAFFDPFPASDNPDGGSSGGGGGSSAGCFTATTWDGLNMLNLLIKVVLMLLIIALPFLISNLRQLKVKK